MRIERRGNIQKLTPRLERFIEKALGGEILDELQHEEERKADYKCLRGLLAIELKSLVEDATQRIDNLVDELRERPDWPAFLGSAPMDSFLKHIDEPEPVRRKLTERVGRAIRNHIHKANKQLAAFEHSFPRKNLVRLVVFANENHEIYDPEMATYIIQHLLGRKEGGSFLYEHIDAVVFLTEKHATHVAGQIAFPLLCINGPAMENSPWKDQVLDLVMYRWAKWSGAALYRADPQEFAFSAIDDIPKRMRRQEQWELDYRRNPYMEEFSDDAVRDLFDEMICLSSLAFIRDSPLKPPDTVVRWCMMTMSHMMLEMGRRAIPVTQFAYVPHRLVAAARRLQLPYSVVRWFQEDLKI